MPPRFGAWLLVCGLGVRCGFGRGRGKMGGVGGELQFRCQCNIIDSCTYLGSVILSVV